jgi:hypothetical protein
MGFTDFINKTSKQIQDAADNVSKSDFIKKADKAINDGAKEIGKAGQNIADSIKNQSDKPKDKPSKK